MPTESQQKKRFRVKQSAVLFLIFLLFAQSPGLAQHRFLENGQPITRGSDVGFLLDTPTRIKVDLSGSWGYSVDGGPSGSVRVPCAYDFRGGVTFQRAFELTKDQLDGYRFHLVMLGVNHSCDVLINGEFVTHHTGGYTSVVEPLPVNALQEGRENLIRVSVSNDLDAKTTLPIRPAVWGVRNYGGIIRDMYLLGTPQFYIRDADVHTEPAENGASARVTVNVLPDGSDSLTGGSPSAGASRGGDYFYCEMIDRMSGIPVGRSSLIPLVRKGSDWEEVKAEFLVQNPRLWSPDSPELYLVRCYLGRLEGKETRIIDEYDLTAGIRKIAVSGGRILLNGSRLSLRGVIWYEDHPTWGSALTDEQREKDIVLMKTLGANLVRFIAHPPHPYMLNLCDRYGLLAMVELPLVQTPGEVLASENYADLAATAMREMVARDRSHPSVLAWGLGDEFDCSHPSARPFVEGLVRLARSLDDRPLYFGALPGATACTDLVDIAAVNLRTQDLKVFRSELESWRTAHRRQPVILAKFGSEVENDNHNGYSDPLSQEAQARFFLQRFDLLKSLDYDGGIVWSFNDWKGDRPSLSVQSADPWLHSMGLVSAEREKRLAYDAVRAIFHGERYVALPVGNHTTGSPVVYTLAGFVLLIGLAYVYNASRRFRESLNRSLLNSYNFFADVRDQRIVSLGQSTLLGLVVSIAIAIVVSSTLLHFRESLVLDNLLSFLLVSDEAKNIAVHLIWNPLRFIGVGSLVVFACMVLVAGAVHALRLLVRSRIYPFHAYTVTMWSAVPLLTLVPVGMVLYRVLDSSLYVVPVFALFCVLGVWVFLRLLKGVSIIIDVYPLKVYCIGVLTVVAVLAAVYAYYDYTQSAPMYLSFLYTTMINSQ